VLTTVVARPKNTIFGAKLCETVFCHNDLLAGNILVSEQASKVCCADLVFIDFEYSAYNVAAFDIANHFAAIPESVLIQTGQYGALPDLAFSRTFLANYFGEELVTDHQLDEALEIVSVFHLAAELRWVLWAFVQAAVQTPSGDASSHPGFDYNNYALQRLQRGYLDNKADLGFPVDQMRLLPNSS
jgi:ethanolamine kinase